MDTTRERATKRFVVNSRTNKILHTHTHIYINSSQLIRKSLLLTTNQ
jgi:calcineurin-like phosphoesterase